MEARTPRAEEGLEQVSQRSSYQSLADETGSATTSTSNPSSYITIPKNLDKWSITTPIPELARESTTTNGFLTE
jgi:hypothetical protein